MTLVTTIADRTAAAAQVRVASVLFIAALTAAASQVSFPLPFTPVPFTLQPVIVLAGGAALGARLGFASQALYIAAGLAGLPVFAFAPGLPQGLARLAGPTGGYLLSYPVAAFVVGLLAERAFDRRFLTSLAAMTAGLLIIFAGGVLWLAMYLPGPYQLASAVRAGLLPFAAADLVKVVVAASVLPWAWRLLAPSPHVP